MIDFPTLKPGTLLRCKAFYFHAKPGDIFMFLSFKHSGDYPALTRLTMLSNMGKIRNFSVCPDRIDEEWDVIAT